MTTVNRYRVYNTVTQAFEFGWSDVTPIKAFSNANQNIDSTKTIIIDTVKQANVISLREDYKGTNGFYQAEGYQLTANPGFSNQMLYTQPIPTVIMDIKFQTTAAMEGDILELYTDDKIVGVTTEAANINTTVVKVSDTVVQNVVPGFWIRLNNGVNVMPYVMVVSVDLTTNQLTLQTALPFTYAAGSAVIFRIYFAKNYVIGPPMLHHLGGNIQGGVQVPPNMINRAAYTNQGSTTKSIKFYVQRLY